MITITAEISTQMMIATCTASQNGGIGCRRMREPSVSAALFYDARPNAAVSAARIQED